MFLGQREQAMQSFQSALAEAMKSGDETIMVRAYCQMGAEYMFSGQLSQAGAGTERQHPQDPERIG